MGRWQKMWETGIKFQNKIWKFDTQCGGFRKLHDINFPEGTGKLTRTQDLRTHRCPGARRTAPWADGCSAWRRWYPCLTIASQLHKRGMEGSGSLVGWQWLGFVLQFFSTWPQPILNEQYRQREKTSSRRNFGAERPPKRLWTGCKKKLLGNQQLSGQDAGTGSRTLHTVGPEGGTDETAMNMTSTRTSTWHGINNNNKKPRARHIFRTKKFRCEIQSRPEKTRSVMKFSFGKLHSQIHGNPTPKPINAPPVRRSWHARAYRAAHPGCLLSVAKLLHGLPALDGGLVPIGARSTPHYQRPQHHDLLRWMILGRKWNMCPLCFVFKVVAPPPPWRWMWGRHAIGRTKMKN